MSENDCKHEEEEHLADYSSASAGHIRWCPNCGAISVTLLGSEREWRLPKCLENKNGRE